MKNSRAAMIPCITLMFCAAMAISSSAQTLTTLVSFDGTNGADPDASLIQAKDGNLYGTTQYGGPVSGCEGGFDPCGTVFKVTTGGTLTTLHTFVYSDGAFPVSPVMQGSDGNFYGTNQGEGDSGGYGAIFKMTSSGKVTVLSYIGSQAGLVQGRDGNFYGTTWGGYNNGTVFKVTPSGTFTTLYTFSGGADGAHPLAGLIQGTDGNFYGTTSRGGSSTNCGGGCGTVFKITPGGSLTSLHSFSLSDGQVPIAVVVRGTDGNFYGTASGGGAGGSNGGTVFKITSSGTFTLLHTFNGSDGYDPSAGLVQASDGNFYGTTRGGGANSSGTVFSITPGGSLTTLYSFCSKSGCADGSSPVGGVVQASDGNFYGTTSGGGAGGNNDGTVFKLSVAYSTLTVTTSGNGLVTSTDGYISCPGTCSHKYLDNTQVTLNETPAGGWAFTGWGGACSGSGSSCQVTMTQNQSVSAAFYQLPVTLTVSVVGSGTVKSTDGFINCPGSSCQHTYNPGAQVTLNATPASGWAFSGWTGACMGIGSCSITMTQNFSLTGVFVEPGAGIQFTPVTPCRVVDTRQSQPIQSNSSQSFNVPQLGGCGIPSTAAAYSLNVTAIPHKKLGYLTIWPTGEAQPTVSLMNSPDGRTKANAAIVPAGTQGAVSVFVTDISDVILDINGYFATPGSKTYQFFPLPPCRIIDTRGGDNGPLQKGQERDYTMAGQCGIPTNATAYSFNVTVMPTNKELDYLTVWPQGNSMPVVSTLNDSTGTVVANAAIVPAGNSGITAFYAHDNPSNLLVDVNGYFAPAGSGYSFYAVAPCRVLDTRSNGGKPFSGPKVVPVEGSACAPPSNATAYVFNATVVPPGTMGYLTLWPDTEDQPNVSTLNAYDGFVTSNMAIVPTKNGAIDAYAAASTHLILDLSGYFAP